MGAVSPAAHMARMLLRRQAMMPDHASRRQTTDTLKTCFSFMYVVVMGLSI